MSPEEAQEAVGRRVVYRPYPGAAIEEGVVTSVSGPYVFVRYGDGQTSKASWPGALEFAS